MSSDVLFLVSRTARPDRHEVTITLSQAEWRGLMNGGVRKHGAC